jgi:hypothetical protein
MKALLVTRCGCSRLIDADIKPGEFLIVPISPVNQMPSMAAAMNDALETIGIIDNTRKFKLWDLNDYFYTKGGERIWVYRETV